jgi:hypothetical protein
MKLIVIITLLALGITSIAAMAGQDDMPNHEMFVFSQGETMLDTIKPIQEATGFSIAIDPAVLRKLRRTKPKQYNLRKLPAPDALEIFIFANGFGLIDQGGHHYLITSQRRAADWGKHLPVIVAH